MNKKRIYIPAFQLQLSGCGILYFICKINKKTDMSGIV